MASGAQTFPPLHFRRLKTGHDNHGRAYSTDHSLSRDFGNYPLWEIAIVHSNDETELLQGLPSIPKMTRVLDSVQSAQQYSTKEDLLTEPLTSCLNRDCLRVKLSIGHTNPALSVLARRLRSEYRGRLSMVCWTNPALLSLPSRSIFVADHQMPLRFDRN